MGFSPFSFATIDATTWVYLSSLLMIALYFKFGRTWSVRNADLILLILPAPGLLLVHHGRTTGNEITELIGFLALLGMTAVLLARVLLDPALVRRPLLEPNLTTGGLSFLVASLLVFLVFNVVTSRPSAGDLDGPQGAAKMLTLNADDGSLADGDSYWKNGPGYPWLHVLPNIVTLSFLNETDGGSNFADAAVAKVMAVLAQLAVVAGIIFVAYRHFDNLRTGIGAAALYLLLPYTEQMAGHVSHVLPAALLIWAVAFYRRPLVAGIFLGLAMGASYYPFFLLPLWLSFYWRRGMWRLLLGIAPMLLLTVLSLLLLPVNGFWTDIQVVFGLWLVRMTDLEGVWGLGWYPVYRIPVMAGFCALCFSFALWPAQKNLGTLMSCSAAVMLAAQFWHGFGGGLYMAWYLPLVLLVVFRPNLEDRVALAVLGEGWLTRRRRRADARLVEKAA